MTIDEAIRRDHAALRGWLTRVGRAGETMAAELDRAYRELRAMSAVHMKGEEDFFYPALKEHAASRFDALESLEEHHLLRVLEREMDGMVKGAEQWRAKFAAYTELSLHHFEEEETRLFVELKREVDEGRRGELGQRFEARRRLARLLEPAAL